MMLFVCIDGMIAEMTLLGQGPPFVPRALSAPVTIWHGAHNAMQPLARIDAIARDIPGARLEIVPEAGVLFDVDAYVAILKALAKPWR
jgi:pimeloyl-ACP methyl ester carboxylesterase